VTAAEVQLVLHIEKAWAAVGNDPADKNADEEFCELLSSPIFSAHDQAPIDLDHQPTRGR
jgi:hypothetical protein